MSQLQNEIAFSSNQYSSLNTQYTLLQGETKQERQRLDSITTELADMTRRVSCMTTDLSATQESKENLQKQIKIVHDQLDLATTALSQEASFFLKLASCATKIATFKLRLLNWSRPTGNLLHASHNYLVLVRFVALYTVSSSYMISLYRIQRHSNQV